MQDICPVENGRDGCGGHDGVGVSGIQGMELVEGSLVVTYTDGTIQNLGPINGGSSLPDDTGDTDKLVFEILGDGTVSVAIKDDYRNSAESIVIPSSYNGRAVSTIAAGGFKQCTNLKTITIPDCVSAINMAAFLSCSKLESVRLPASLTEIEARLFGNCKALSSLYVPASIAYIHAEAFGGIYSTNSALGSVVFEDTSGWQRRWWYAVENSSASSADQYGYMTPTTGSWVQVDAASIADPSSAASLLLDTFSNQVSGQNRVTQKKYEWKRL